MVIKRGGMGGGGVWGGGGGGGGGGVGLSRKFLNFGGS